MQRQSSRRVWHRNPRPAIFWLFWKSSGYLISQLHERGLTASPAGVMPGAASPRHPHRRRSRPIEDTPLRPAALSHWFSERSNIVSLGRTMTELPPPEPSYLSYASPGRSPKGLAIASMVCGISSIPLLACAWFLAIPAAIVAVVLGVIARRRASRGEAEGKGMALAGMICGSASLGLAVLAISAVVVFFRMAKTHPSWMPSTSSTSGTTIVTVAPTGLVPATAPATAGGRSPR
jgi:hypothetical protein